MLSLPSAAEPLLVSLSVAFTEPTFKRVLPLIVGAILTVGRRTVPGVPRTMRSLAPGHWSDYHRVELVSGTGQWYRSGEGLVPVRWVYTHDIQGTHRDDYFYSTDPTLEAAQIVSWFTARWPIETTFQEMRAQLGFETTRQRTEKSVTRTAPCLFGLFSLVCLVYAEHRKRRSPRPACTDWYVKNEPTFADAIATVRRLFWEKTVFQQSVPNVAFEKVPRGLRNLLLDCLSRAA